ncbi:MAG: thioredoxin domain-containing protein [Acidimicrobiia bacterium]|nr:thioredoxin domain-containing protein [Acidimicrobiia bacterium]
MERLIVLVVLSLVAVAVALLMQRRRPDPPSAPSYRAPSQLDRDDFDRPDAPALVVVFASDTCQTCPEVWEAVRQLPSERIAVQKISFQASPDLHKRYRIDGVPTTVIANDEGVVVDAFFGPVRLDDIVASLGGNSA